MVGGFSLNPTQMELQQKHPVYTRLMCTKYILLHMAYYTYAFITASSADFTFPNWASVQLIMTTSYPLKYVPKAIFRFLVIIRLYLRACPCISVDVC